MTIRKQRGAITMLNDDMKGKIRFLNRLNVKADDIAKLLDISPATIEKWRVKHAEFFATLDDWRRKADDEIERTLWERARGYSHPETKTHYDTSEKEWVKTEVMRHYPPDPTSMVFWLKNRRPAKWRDKREIDYADKTVRIEHKRFDGDYSDIGEDGATDAS